jgi:hypothetical protein
MHILAQKLVNIFFFRTGGTETNYFISFSPLERAKLDFL